MTLAKTEKAEPSDPKKDDLSDDDAQGTYWIIYISFFVLGVVQILPWTFFLNANEYWMYKFRNTTLAITDTEHRTKLQAQFSATLNTALQISTICASYSTMLVSHKFDAKRGILTCLSAVVLLLITATAFTKVDTSDWQSAFFVMSIGLIALVMAMNAAMSVSFYTVVSCFPAQYLGAYVNGQGLSAIVSSVLQVLSILGGLAVEDTALIYFTCGAVVVALALGLFVLASSQEYFVLRLRNHHENKHSRMISWQEAKISARKIWTVLVALFFWLVIFMPLNSITPLVVSESKQGTWSVRYFVPVATFLNAAVMDLIGRAVSTKYPELFGHIGFIGFSVLRLVFTPLLILCNAQPRPHDMSVIFPHDYQYVIILVVYYITNGIAVGLVNMKLPLLVDASERERAFQVYLAALGLFGALSGLLGPVLVELL